MGKITHCPEGCFIVPFKDRHFNEYDILLNPSQTMAWREFYSNNAMFVGYGGGVRAGKTFLGCVLAVEWSRYENNIGIICRPTFKEIESIIWNEQLKPMLDKMYGTKYKYDKKLNVVHLPNGSQIVFQALKNSNGATIDLNKALMGRGIGWFWIDQSEMCSESNFNALIHRMSLKHVPRRFGFVNFNPRGHDWNYKVFVNPATRRKGFAFVQAKTEDNTSNVAADYISMVKNDMHEDWRKRWIDGSFDAWEGLIYPTFNENTHVIPHLDGLDHNFKIYLGMDHGYNNPCAICFFTVTKDGIVIQFDEYYERGKLVKEYYVEVMNKVKKWGRNKIDGYSVLDPSAWKTQNDGSNIEDIFRELSTQYDFNLLPYRGINDKIAGLNRVGSYILIDPKLRHPITKEMGSPRFLVTENCEKTRWEFGQYHWKKSPDLNVDIETGIDFENLPEEPANRNNHAMDAIRYFLMTRPQPIVEEDVRRYIPRQGYKPLSSMTGY